MHSTPTLGGPRRNTTISFYIEKTRMVEIPARRWKKVWGYRIHRVQKKRCNWFFCCNFCKYWRIFIILRFSCTTSQENAKVNGVKIYHHTFVMLLPYRVKVSDTKVTHFTLILALCTCLYRSRLRKPVSIKQTKHSRKSEAQNLCSKCPPFTRTHAFNRLRHCAIADGFGYSVQSWCYAAALLGTRG